MRKIEQKLLAMFNSNLSYQTKTDRIIVDSCTNTRNYTACNYYNYDSLVFSKRTNINGGKIIYFCLPSFDGYLSNTTKSRVNTFLSEYDLKVTQKNYKYFCNDTELKLDTSYFINKDDKGKYFIQK